MSGWNSTQWQASCDAGWRARRELRGSLPRIVGGWTVVDVVAAVVALYVGFGPLIAFLALKLWQQASGHPGNALVFAFEKWEQLVAVARRASERAELPFSLHLGSFHLGHRSSGNHAFDTWRDAELARIDAERIKMKAAEREFAAYRDELLHAKDREDFERFMQSRRTPSA